MKCPQCSGNANTMGGNPYRCTVCGVWSDQHPDPVPGVRTSTGEKINTPRVERPYKPQWPI